MIVSYCAIFIANKLELYFMIMVSDDEDHRHDKGRVLDVFDEGRGQ